MNNIETIMQRVDAFFKNDDDTYIVQSSSQCVYECETTYVVYATCDDEIIRVIATFVEDAFSYMTIIRDDDEFYVE